MSQQQTVPAHTGIIERPLCIVCATQMWLSRVEAEGLTHDKQTFECLVCETHEIALVRFK